MKLLPVSVAGLLALAAPLRAAEPAAPEVQATAEAPAPSPTPSPAPAVASPLPASGTAADVLPPMNFYASVASKELLQQVKAAPAFARLDAELVGSPIQLRVTHSLQPTAGGQAAGLLSAIWAGSTLGLLPVVTSNNFVLSYEIRVNGQEIARYDFSRSFTRAVNIWMEKNDPTYGLGQDGLDWAKSTAAEFAAKAAQDPAVVALAKEYAFYFGPGAT